MPQFTLIRRLAVPALAAALIVAGAWWGLGPGPRLAVPVIVEIPSGSGHTGIARQLADAGVIRSPLGFEAWSLLHRRDRLKAGTYRFTGGATVPAVYRMLARGQFYSIALVVPEGYSRFDIARELAERGLADPAAFLRVTADPSLVRDLDPAAVSLEGYLFPATYPVPPHADPAHLAALMVARFRRELRDEGAHPADLHAWVTLASLVEKETSVPAERPLVAGVFTNRLAQRLPLQCDPTVIYAAVLAGRYDGSLHRADLDFDSPYNTYRHPGLPPGPIANPGRQALLAAAQPAHTGFMYFVSDGHGQHRFARTLAEQRQNVQLYLRALRGGGH
ncbi:MAG TPA: endolytic transglycosylase MltG [Terriglobales bacterium]|nr:endolytic transglycosylase MltG [Terriglobales bacterium]